MIVGLVPNGGIFEWLVPLLFVGTLTVPLMRSKAVPTGNKDEHEQGSLGYVLDNRQAPIIGFTVGDYHVGDRAP